MLCVFLVLQSELCFRFVCNSQSYNVEHAFKIQTGKFTKLNFCSFSSCVSQLSTQRVEATFCWKGLDGVDYEGWSR